LAVAVAMGVFLMGRGGGRGGEKKKKTDRPVKNRGSSLSRYRKLNPGTKGAHHGDPMNNSKKRSKSRIELGRNGHWRGS